MADFAAWHRRLCPLTDRLMVSGDLPEDRERALALLRHWEEAGVTHVMDTRSERSDEDFVAQNAPGVLYRQVPTEDDGRTQPDEWFESGLRFYLAATEDPRAVVLVHCNVGINRGPSMAYRILLELGWDAIGALDRIREARPIANIGYAFDALDHFHRSWNVEDTERTLDRDRVEAWTRGY